MEKIIDLENELLKIIEYYYPKNIIETGDLIYINSEEIKRRNKVYAENKDILTWNKFVEDNSNLTIYSGFDYSGLRDYNFCYRFLISNFNNFCYLFSSALTPAFCFVNFNNNCSEFEWNSLNDFNSPLIKSYKTFFPKSILIPEKILKIIPIDFYVQPYTALGEAKIYDYIFANYQQPYEV